MIEVNGVVVPHACKELRAPRTIMFHVFGLYTAGVLILHVNEEHVICSSHKLDFCTGLMPPPSTLVSSSEDTCVWSHTVTDDRGYAHRGLAEEEEAAE